jgi:hypothetical protein
MSWCWHGDHMVQPPYQELYSLADTFVDQHRVSGPGMYILHRAGFGAPGLHPGWLYIPRSGVWTTAARLLTPHVAQCLMHHE